MEFGWTKEELEFREEVEDFLRHELTEEVIKEATSGPGYGPHSWDFVRKLGRKGWLCPNWPKEYGGMGSSYMKKFIIIERLAYHRAPYKNYGSTYIGPVIMAYGSEEQKSKYLPMIARGEIDFALGYTEPEAGTDLAALQMKATRQGDEYIINGQKRFSTLAHAAQYHWLMTRTDPTVPKHKGLSLFIVDLQSPGITIRPLWGIGGLRTNEVFYDDVHIPAKNLVGKENRGWYQVMDALQYERLSMSLLPQCQPLMENLIEYCRNTIIDGISLSKNPLVRQKIAQMSIEIMIGNLFSWRLVWMLNKGQMPDYESAVGKVFNTEVRYHMFNEGVQIMGLYGQLKPGSRYVQLEGTLEQGYEVSFSEAIGGGGNDIMRNIIAQRGLGLPR